jgi:hypothetical protein
MVLQSGWNCAVTRTIIGGRIPFVRDTFFVEILEECGVRSVE